MTILRKWLYACVFNGFNRKILRLLTNSTKILNLKAVLAILFVIEMDDMLTKYFLRKTEILVWPIAVNCEAVPGFQKKTLRWLQGSGVLDLLPCEISSLFVPWFPVTAALILLVLEHLE